MMGSLGITGITGNYWDHCRSLASLWVTGSSGSTGEAQGITGFTGGYWERWRGTGSAGQQNWGGTGNTKKGLGELQGRAGSTGKYSKGVTGDTGSYWEHWALLGEHGGLLRVLGGHWWLLGALLGGPWAALGPTAEGLWALVALGQCPQCLPVFPPVPPSPLLSPSPSPVSPPCPQLCPGGFGGSLRIRVVSRGTGDSVALVALGTQGALRGPQGNL